MSPNDINNAFTFLDETEKNIKWFPLYRLEADVEQICPHLGADNYDDAVHDDEDAEHQEEDIAEPAVCVQQSSRSTLKFLVI